MKYVPLHVHSDASLDGAGTVQSLVDEAKRIGLEALALTDHGTLANAVAFWSACDQVGIKPILGIEAYLMYNGSRHHVTLLSLSELGFNNLIYLDSWSHTKNFVSGYPLITLNVLHDWCKDIHVLTGCASSALYRGTEEEGRQYVADLLDVVDRDNLGLETMFIGSHDTWNRPIEIAKRTRLPIVVTNDTHYPCQHQFPAHQAITSARRGFTYDSQHLWLKSADEIIYEGSKFTDEGTVVKGLKATLDIADRVESWSMKSKPTLPSIPDVVETLTVALKDALKKDVALKGEQQVRVDRLKYEFKILHDSGFLDYIYILWDIVSWAKKEGIYVGPGRGSGGGSYTLYLLGITDIDPIHFGLLFERFINPSRGDYPDVDVDFESDQRARVMEYASNRWGTIPIATYSTYSHKSAVHDIARTLRIPKDLEEEAAESERDSDKFTEFINYKPDALVTYDTMIGQIRHRGKHAAGVIIPNRPVPIERSGDELVAAWAEGQGTKYLSETGIVKYDLLGLTALSQLKRMKQLSTSVGPSSVDFDDPNVYDLFCRGDVAGIFQWSGSDGIRELTMKVAPRNFYDLTTCNALYRPGALDAGTAEHYPEFMKSPRLIHPRIDKHLTSTYGVVCYQEQVMAIVAEVMGGDLAQADIARRLISKAAVGDPKWEREMFELQTKFMDTGTKQGFEINLLDNIWHEIYTHSRYSYNLAHATAYTLISYQMAWYKVYFRPAFTVSVLQYDNANAQTYIIDAVSHGLDIVMPHVNFSGNNYMLHDGKIFLPLTDISFLGDKAAAAIIEESFDGGPFVSYEDFAKRIPKRICNNRAKKFLERIGAFDGLSGDPSAAIDDYESIPLKNKYQTQMEVLGYVVPSTIFLAKIQKLLDQPTKKGYSRFAGFVSKAQHKKSSHGAYVGYKLSPEGEFWMRGEEAQFKVGDFVSGTRSKFRHSTDCKRYRLGSE